MFLPSQMLSSDRQSNEHKHSFKSTCEVLCDRGYEILKMINRLKILSVCSSGYFISL